MGQNSNGGLEKSVVREYYQAENVFNLISENFSDIFNELLKIDENESNQ